MVIKDIILHLAEFMLNSSYFIILLVLLCVISHFCVNFKQKNLLCGWNQPIESTEGHITVIRNALHNITELQKEEKQMCVFMPYMSLHVCVWENRHNQRPVL